MAGPWNIMSAWEAFAARAVEVWAQILPHLRAAEVLLSNPWARAFGLSLIVYLTIRVIASIYSGDKQNSELGPIGIRPHAAQRLDRKTIVLPRRLMPMNMDGVSANVKFFYAFTDAKGKPRKQLVHKIEHCRLAVSPTNLASVKNVAFGYEVPDVATEDVCFPPVDLQSAPEQLPATPDRAREYVALHKIIENWKEDDEALLISLHQEQQEEVIDAREQFILTGARKVAAARNSNFLQRMFSGDIARKRPNVIGSYYLKFEFSHDPWFVLTRHPDRELKMTAWLTVLTSMFALVMDAWPKESTRPHGAENSSVGREIPRGIRPPNP